MLKYDELINTKLVDPLAMHFKKCMCFYNFVSLLILMHLQFSCFVSFSFVESGIVEDSATKIAKVAVITVNL